MGFVSKSASVLRTLQSASPSGLIKLLPELTKSANPSVQKEISRRLLQNAAYLSPSQICHLARSEALSFDPKLVARLEELKLDVIGNLSAFELIELLNSTNTPEVSRALIAKLESMDFSGIFEEAKVALLVHGVRDLEISDIFRSKLAVLIGNYSKKFSSQSAAQVALSGGKKKFPITPEIAEEISDRLTEPRHMANAIFGFSRWGEIPSDVIFGLIKKINFQNLILPEKNQVLSAMITRKLPAHKFFAKCTRNFSQEISDSHALLLLQAATQIRGLKSPGLKFYLEILPKKFPTVRDRKVACLLLTGFSLAGVLPPEGLRSEIFSAVEKISDHTADISDFSSISRLCAFTDDRKFSDISDLLLTRLMVCPVPAGADDVVNALLALGRLASPAALTQPGTETLARKYLHAVEQFPTLSSKRRVNVLYAVLRALPNRDLVDMEICRQLAAGVDISDLTDHLKLSFDDSVRELRFSP